MLNVGVRRFSGAFGALLCGAAIAVAIAACGHTARLIKGHVLGVALMEYRLRPNEIVVPAGRLRVSVHNYGRLTHNLVIATTTPTTTVQASTSGKVTETTTVAGHTADLAPGQSTTMTLALKPGRYRLYSGVSSDEALGEQGTLTVVSK